MALRYNRITKTITRIIADALEIRSTFLESFLKTWEDRVILNSSRHRYSRHRIQIKATTAAGWQPRHARFSEQLRNRNEVFVVVHKLKHRTCDVCTCTTRITIAYRDI